MVMLHTGRGHQGTLAVLKLTWTISTFSCGIAANDVFEL
jgi:hypothetical protein